MLLPNLARLATLAGLMIALPLHAAPAKKAATPKGNVTRAQVMAQARQVFDRADTNKDNFMSLAEFGKRMTMVLNRNPPGTPGAPSKEQAQKMLNAAVAAFHAVDTNGDGKLSREEASRRPLAAFDMIDTNHDGVVTLAEKLAAHKAAAAAGALEPAGPAGARPVTGR
ncbi:MAG: hypothetical protein JWN66_4818 [Sphingomonas bacterium]|uniref:EF-hand domain-containing protein n=1 Tax=Sphingomonas bacterium TaxID=1895847 RepID=UPI00260489E2|nr:EF-hand domain-containing protein [Sphingomonas bacterium]MDB5707702.1 hypothetical protein [Sphingomonas bacterium]